MNVYTTAPGALAPGATIMGRKMGDFFASRLQNQIKLLWQLSLGKKFPLRIAEYFDQQKGSSRDIHWSKQFFSEFKHLFPSQTRKLQKSQKIKMNPVFKCLIFRWLLNTHFYVYFSLFFFIFLYFWCFFFFFCLCWKQALKHPKRLFRQAKGVNNTS